MRYRIALIIVVILIGLFGCSRGKIKKDFVGTWNPANVDVDFFQEGFQIDEFIQPILVEAEETVYTFHSDGTVELKLVDSIKTGKWKSKSYSNNDREIIVLLFKGEKEKVLEVVSHSEDELIVKSEFATGFFTISFEKEVPIQ